MFWHIQENPIFIPMPKVKPLKGGHGNGSWYGVRPEKETPPMPPTASLSDVDRDFVAIYKILSAVEQGMDTKEGVRLPDAAEFGITGNRCTALLQMLSDAGYLFIMQGKTMDGRMVERPPWLTLKGLEYLWNSPQMHKAAEMAQKMATEHV